MAPAVRHRTTILVAAGALAVGTALAAPGAAAAAGGSGGSATQTSGVHAGQSKVDPNADVDIRVPATSAEREVATQREAKAAARPDVRSLKASLGAQGLVDVDGLTGTPRQVARVDGFLTAPSSAKASDIALGYVRGKSEVFRLSSTDLANLRLSRDYVDIAGTHHLTWVQTSGGLDLYGNGLKANVAKDGRLISVLGSPVPGLAAPSALSSPSLASSRSAIGSARKDLGDSAAAEVGDSAKQVLFQTPGGTRRAWQVITMGSAKPSVHVLDAETGRILYRASLSSDANGPSTPAAPAAKGANLNALIFDNFPGAPRGGTARKVSMNRPGWFTTGATTLTGNNAHTYTDVNDDNAPQASEEVNSQGGPSFRFTLVRAFPAGQPCDIWICTWDPETANSWAANRQRTATNNFYLVNLYHDHLAKAPIGFTEAAGNFQLVNASGQGLGGDPLQDEPLDGASTAAGLPDGDHIDNANMNTPPDGTSPRMQMYLFHEPGTTYPAEDPFIAVSGADEADVVFHEYTHGLSNRLVTNASGVGALRSAQSGAMGEAWSDWYAFDLLVDQGFAKDTAADGDLRVGDYAGAGVDVVRTQPLDCPVGSESPKCHGRPNAGQGGYTYGDFGKISSRGAEVHSDGEIWGETLWDVRSKLGSKLTESLVTRGMELSPPEPSMLDMRNSILQADTVLNGGSHLKTLWKLFATRGMGYFAAATSGADTAPVEDFQVPPTGAPNASLDGVVTTAGTTTPAAGVTVFFGGHASGFAGDLAAVTDAQGRYLITGFFPGRYADVVAGGPGYLPQVRTLSLHQGRNTVNWSAVRNWAQAAGGASITETNDDTGAPFGCGAAALIDGNQGVGWSAFLPGPGQDVHAVVQLPTSVNVSSVQVDPSGTCGDDISASTGDYRFETSTDGTTWTVAATGHFTPAQIHTLANVPLAAGSTAGVRFVRLVLLGTQTGDFGVDCTTVVTSGCVFIDASELVVQGTPAT
ncbi:M36 family metallopeptidase [Angustibacter sp. McL0619]|uniref:M36 family metallopeptidase n=1 Tax=Angustibacter sp. McL0619 TaxID=3415676 RepID=UPI003CF03B85